MQLDEAVNASAMVHQLDQIQGLLEKTGGLGIGTNASDAARASAGEAILEGLYAHRRISRSEERVFGAEEKRRSGADEQPGPERKGGRESKRNFQ